MPITFFKNIAEKYSEIESVCKKEEIFFLVKQYKHSGSNQKSQFFSQFYRIKSLILNGILKNALMVKMSSG